MLRGKAQKKSIYEAYLLDVEMSGFFLERSR